MANRRKNIINSYLKSKNQRKKRKGFVVNQQFNRVLGSKVLHTNKILKTSKLKNVTLDKSLSKITINHGFNRVMREIYNNDNSLKYKISKITHSSILSTLSFIVNDIILNADILLLSLQIFFILNLTTYSIYTLYNYFYSPKLVTLLMIFSYGISLIITSCVNFYKKKKKNN